MRVLVLHTVPPDAPEAGRLKDEFDLSGAACNIASALPQAVVCGVRGEAREILACVDLHQPDVVFNLCEAPLGRPELEAHAASLFEYLGIRFTGCGSETLALCRRKDAVNALLYTKGIPVPQTIDPAQPKFPCIVKPVDEDGSAGLTHESVCQNAEALWSARNRMPGRALIEEFLSGREFAVSLWGRSEPEFVSIGETLFQQDLQLITYAAKWHIESADFANSPLSYTSEIAPALRNAIVASARGAWRAVAARHAVRVDVRLDLAGNPRVLDVNPNPEISAGVGICRAVQEAGWKWTDFVHSLIAWA